MADDKGVSDEPVSKEEQAAVQAVQSLVEGFKARGRDGVLLVVFANLVEPESGGVRGGYREGWAFKSAKEALAELAPLMKEHYQQVHAKTEGVSGLSAMWETAEVIEVVSESCAEGFNKLSARWILAVWVSAAGKQSLLRADAIALRWREGIAAAAERLGAVGPARAGAREDDSLVESDLTEGLTAMAEAQAIGEALPKAEPGVAPARLKL